MRRSSLLFSLSIGLFPLCVYSQEAPIAAPAPAPRSAFEQMLVTVYQENPRLNAERRSLNMADERVSQANSGFRPTVDANLAGGRQRQKISGRDWQYGDATAGSLVVTQPIFSGFGTVEQKRAAEMRVLAGRARLLTIEQNVLFTAISDWLELNEKEQTLKLIGEHRERLSFYTSAQRQRFKAGDGTDTDVAQAESRYAQADARYASALAARDATRATFTRDTGLNATAVELAPLPNNLPRSLEEAVTQAHDNPALEQALQEEKAAEHDIGIAESALWPKVFLRGSMSEEQASFLGLNSLRNDAITLNVSIPLYQGGGEYSRVREAKLARQKSREDALDANRSVVERTQLAWANYRSAHTVIDASARAVSASSRALSGVQEEQKQGLRTVTDLLDEQSERLNAQLQETQAQKSIRVEAYRLLAATGKLTGASLGLPTAIYDPAVHHDAVTPLWAGLTPRSAPTP